MIQNTVDREDNQLIFAVRHYWSLAQRHYKDINTSDYYLMHTLTTNNHEMYYRMHVTSCCCRIAAYYEKRAYSHRQIYSKIKNSTLLDSKEISFLLRDTIAHKQDPNHNYEKLRERYLRTIRIEDLHKSISTIIHNDFSQFAQHGRLHGAG